MTGDGASQDVSESIAPATAALRSGERYGSLTR